MPSHNIGYVNHCIRGTGFRGTPERVVIRIFRLRAINFDKAKSVKMFKVVFLWIGFQHRIVHTTVIAESRKRLKDFPKSRRQHPIKLNKFEVSIPRLIYLLWKASVNKAGGGERLSG